MSYLFSGKYLLQWKSPQNTGPRFCFFNFRGIIPSPEFILFLKIFKVVFRHRNIKIQFYYLSGI